MILFLLSVSCQQEIRLNLPENETTFTFNDFPKKDSLIFKEFSEVDEYLLLPVLSDSVILYTVLHQKFALDIISKNTGGIIKRELPIGKGVNEILATFGHGIICDTIYWVYEGETNIIRLYLLKDILDTNVNAKVLMKINFDMERFPFKIIPIIKDRFIMSGSPMYKSKITVIDKNGIPLFHLGEYRNVLEDTLVYLKGAYRYSVGLRPDNKRIVLAYHRTDVIEIYDLKSGEIIKILHGPDLFDVYPPVTKNNMKNYFRVKDKTIKAYSLYSTQKYIYALYYGIPFKSDDYWGRFLLVFDWDGNPIKYFKLSSEINFFVVDDSSYRIYSVDNKTEKLVYADFQIQ